MSNAFTRESTTTNKLEDGMKKDTRENIEAEIVVGSDTIGTAIMRCPVCGENRAEHDMRTYENKEGTSLELCDGCWDDFTRDTSVDFNSADVLEDDEFDKLYAWVKENKLEPTPEPKIEVHVRGGVAYCDDDRVEIIDHDNCEENPAMVD